MKLIDLVNSVIICLPYTILLRWIAVLLGSLTVTLTVVPFWTYFFLLTLYFFSAVAFRPLGNLDCYCLSFHRLSVKPKSGCPKVGAQKWMPKSGCPKVGALFLLHSLRLFSCWLGRSLIIWEIFHRRLSLNLMLLQLLLNFVNGSRL